MHSILFTNTAVSSSGAIFGNFRFTRARISLMLVIPVGQNTQIRTQKDELNHLEYDNLENGTTILTL